MVWEINNQLLAGSVITNSVSFTISLVQSNTVTRGYTSHGMRIPMGNNSHGNQTRSKCMTFSGDKSRFSLILTLLNITVNEEKRRFLSAFL